MTPVSYTSQGTIEPQTQQINLQKNPQSLAEIIAELKESDFQTVIVKSGDTADKIAKKYYPDLDSVTGLKILQESNKKEDNQNNDLSKLNIDDEIRVPKIESLQRVGAEAFIGKGLVKTTKYNVDQQLIDFVKKEEGFRRLIYDSGVGPKPDETIGYGHKVTKKDFESGRFSAKRIGPRGLTEAQAEEILVQDLERAAARVNGCNLPLTQSEFRALTSLAFNYRDMVPESIRKLILSGNKEAVPNEILEFSHAQGQEVSGLRTRRQAEAEMFRSGL